MGNVLMCQLEKYRETLSSSVMDIIRKSVCRAWRWEYPARSLKLEARAQERC